LISENERELLSTYVLNKITGVEFPHSFTSLKAKSFSLSWNGTKAHADDLQFNLDPGSEINIYVKPSAIKFLV
jgi:hypothetical protein